MIPTLHWVSGIVEGDEHHVRLTPQEARYTAALARAHPWDLKYGRMVQAMWDDPDKEPPCANNVLAVLTVRLNRKLKPFGLFITTEFGWGRVLHGDIRIDFHGVTKRTMPSVSYEARPQTRPFALRIEPRQPLASEKEAAISEAFNKDGLSIAECCMRFHVTERAVVAALIRN